MSWEEERPREQEAKAPVKNGGKGGLGKNKGLP